MYERLVVVAAECVLLNLRFFPVVQHRSGGMIWPLIGRHHGQAKGHIMEELAITGKSELLRH